MCKKYFCATSHKDPTTLVVVIFEMKLYTAYLLNETLDLRVLRKSGKVLIAMMSASIILTWTEVLGSKTKESMSKRGKKRGWTEK